MLDRPLLTVISVLNKNINGTLPDHRVQAQVKKLNHLIISLHYLQQSVDTGQNLCPVQLALAHLHSKVRQYLEPLFSIARDRKHHHQKPNAPLEIPQYVRIIEHTKDIILERCVL